MRVGFAGTPEFARTALAALAGVGHHAIPLVLTQPDRPSGRGLKVLPSPVKAFAAEHAIEVAQPRSLRLDGKFADDAGAAQAVLAAADLDVLVVAAYGLLLPDWVLQMPRFGCLNIHASLLPRWRGAAPVQRAIEAGDRETGITIMQMDAGLDTGDMLLDEAVAIGPDDTSARLLERLAGVGARLIVDALSALADGGLQRYPQPANGVSYAHKVLKSEAPIDWRQPASAIERRIRAFDPFPGASSALAGDASVKCWRAEVCNGEGAPGEVLAADERGIEVACGAGSLRITELQRAGGARLSARQFLQRERLRPGARCGAWP